jgi:hypothetical protein
MITKGPPEHVLNGPILDEAPFPDVLVAKAYSQDGESIDLVLYPGKDAGKFQIGFARLKASTNYSLEGVGNTVAAKASKDGKATFDVELKGRTEFKLVRR